MGSGHPLDADTVALWRFNDLYADTREPAITDSLGGTFTKSPWVPCLTTGPKLGTWARRFEYNATYLNRCYVATNATLYNLLYGTFTAELSVRLDANALTTNWVVAHSGSGASETSGNNALFSVGVLDTGELYLYWETGSGTNTNITTTYFPPFDGVWRLWTILKNSTAKVINVLVDGVAVYTTSYTNDPTDGTAGSLLFGSGSPVASDQQGFNGCVCQFQISDVIRNNTWITAQTAAFASTGLLVTDSSVKYRVSLGSQPAARDIGPLGYHLVSDGMGVTNITGPSESLIRNDVSGGQGRSFNNCLLNATWSQYLKDTFAGSFTVEGFFQVMAPFSSTGNVIFLFGGDTAQETEAYNAVQGTVQTDLSLTFQVEHDAGVNSVVTTAPGLVVIGRIYHVAFRKINTGATFTGSIWLDGVKVAEQTGLVRETGFTNPELVSLKLGGGTQATFFGYLDDVRLSKIARSDAEIVADYTGGGQQDLEVVLAWPDARQGLTITSDRSTARYTPVSFNVYNADSQFCLLIKFRNDDRVYVAYDNAVGFRPPFNSDLSTFLTSATVGPNGESGGRRMTILQNGGWQDSIEWLGIGGDTDPNTNTVYKGKGASVDPPRVGDAPTSAHYSWYLPD